MVWKASGCLVVFFCNMNYILCVRVCGICRRTAQTVNNICIYVCARSSQCLWCADVKHHLWRAGVSQALSDTVRVIRMMLLLLDAGALYRCGIIAHITHSPHIRSFAMHTHSHRNHDPHNVWWSWWWWWWWWWRLVVDASWSSLYITTQ